LFIFEHNRRLKICQGNVTDEIRRGYRASAVWGYSDRIARLKTVNGLLATPINPNLTTAKHSVDAAFRDVAKLFQQKVVNSLTNLLVNFYQPNFLRRPPRSN
jgi:hypothetical protein